MRRIIFVVGILIFTIEACKFAPAPIPVSTVTAQLTQTNFPTDTPTKLPAETLTAIELPTNTSTPTKLPTDTSTSTEFPTNTPTSTKLPTDIPTLMVISTDTPTETKLPTDTPTDPKLSTDTPTSTVSPTFTQTTLTPTPTPSCQSPTAYILLSASAESLKIGDTVVVTATLINDGCGTLGLPQYVLHIQSDGTESIFTPDKPGAVVHHLGVAPGQSDTIEFELKAVASGQATLTASVSYEFHVGYPGPAYWGYSGSREPLIIIVVP